MKKPSLAAGLFYIADKLLRHAAAALAGFGDVLHGADFQSLGISAGLSRGARGGAAAAGGSRTGGAHDLHFVTDMLAQLSGVTRELIRVAVLVGESVVAAGAAQTTLHRSSATGGFRLTGACRCWVGFSGV